MMNDDIEKAVTELGDCPKIAAAAWERRNVAEKELEEARSASQTADLRARKALDKLSRAIHIGAVGPIPDPLA